MAGKRRAEKKTGNKAGSPSGEDVRVADIYIASRTLANATDYSEGYPVKKLAGNRGNTP